jgi:hypothetical protein
MVITAIQRLRNTNTKRLKQLVQKNLRIRALPAVSLKK